MSEKLNFCMKCKFLCVNVNKQKEQEAKPNIGAMKNKNQNKKFEEIEPHKFKNVNSKPILDYKSVEDLEIDKNDDEKNLKQIKETHKSIIFLADEEQNKIGFKVQRQIKNQKTNARFQIKTSEINSLIPTKNDKENTDEFLVHKKIPKHEVDKKNDHECVNKGSFQSLTKMKSKTDKNELFARDLDCEIVSFLLYFFT